MKRKIFLLFLIVFFLILIASIGLLSVNMTPTDQDLVKGFFYPDAKTELNYAKIAEREIRYVKIHVEEVNKRPLLVMIHGAPGDISTFARYANDSLLRAKYDMLIYDRPGYGPRDEMPEEGIKEQALILLQLIENEEFKYSEVMFLSHSYGGPIAAFVSTELADICLGHVMVAPVLDASSEPLFWYSKLPVSWPFNLIASQGIKAASVEKISHRMELEKIKNRWGEINCRTYHFHGEEDWLAPPENISFAKQYFRKGVLQSQIYEDKSHFILWDDETFYEIKRILLTL